MPRLREDTIESRIYGRSRGSRPRYYADFRDYADVGGTQEPLVPLGERYATTDYERAQELAEARLESLQEKRSALPRGETSARTFDALIPEHLRLKVRDREATTQWLGNVQVQSRDRGRLLQAGARPGHRQRQRGEGLLRLSPDAVERPWWDPLFPVGEPVPELALEPVRARDREGAGRDREEPGDRAEEQAGGHEQFDALAGGGRVRRDPPVRLRGV
jgi:hypothetical protein